MKKKGVEMAVGTVIMIVLGLIVLVILIIVVRQQVTRGAAKIGEIGEEVTTTGGCFDLIQGMSCIKVLTGRCPKGMKAPSKGQDGWADCIEKTDKLRDRAQKGTYICCQKIET